jgi:hypothetical protein
MARPRPEQLVEFWNLRTMPTENVRFWQSYVDDKIGPDGKPLCSAIVALLVDDPFVFSPLSRAHTPGSTAYHAMSWLSFRRLFPRAHPRLNLNDRNRSRVAATRHHNHDRCRVTKGASLPSVGT